MNTKYHTSKFLGCSTAMLGKNWILLSQTFKRGNSRDRDVAQGYSTCLSYVRPWISSLSPALKKKKKEER